MTVMEDTAGLRPRHDPGATVKEPAHDVAGGLVAIDPDGSVLGRLQDS
jgi:hypothetical protein